MDASYSIRNESLHDIIVIMEDDDRKRTLRIPPNGEAAFKAHMLDRPDFRVYEAEAQGDEEPRMLTSKNVGPLDSIAASAIEVTYTFDGARLH